MDPSSTSPMARPAASPVTASSWYRLGWVRFVYKIGQLIFKLVLYLVQVELELLVHVRAVRPHRRQAQTQAAPVPVVKGLITVWFIWGKL